VISPHLVAASRYPVQGSRVAVRRYRLDFAPGVRQNSPRVRRYSSGLGERAAELVISLGFAANRAGIAVDETGRLPETDARGEERADSGLFVFIECSRSAGCGHGRFPPCDIYAYSIVDSRLADVVAKNKKA